METYTKSVIPTSSEEVELEFANKRTIHRSPIFNSVWSKLAISVAVAGILVGTSSLTMAQSLRTVLETSVYAHPEYQALSANRSAIGEELVAARGLGLPGVDVKYSVGRLDDYNTDQRYEEWSVIARQPIFDGGKTRSEVGRQGERVLSASERVRDTENTIGLQITQAYLEVVRSRHVLSVARANEKAVRAIVGRVNAKVKGGTANKADKELALSRLYAAQNITAESEVRRHDAEALYLTLTGQKPGKLGKISVKHAALPKSRPAAVALAASASPKVLAMRHDAAAADFAIGTAKSAVLPTVDAEVSANYRDRIAGTSGENKTYKAMLVFKMSLYSGGINQSRIREAEHRAREANELAEAAVLNVEREIRLAWNTYQGAPKKVRALSNQATSSLRVKRLREKQYEAGSSSLISILDAQNEYVIAKVQSINEESMRKFAYFKILAATGTLLESFGIADEENVVDESIVTSSIVPTLAVRPTVTTAAASDVSPDVVTQLAVSPRVTLTDRSKRRKQFLHEGR